MDIYSDVALVLDSKGMGCLDAQLGKLDKDARDDVLEFLDWADEEAESASGWLLCWRDSEWYGDDTIAVHELEWRDTTVVPAPTMCSLRPPVITAEDVADMLGMTVAQAEDSLLDDSTRIIQCMMASAWSAIADIERSM